MIRDATLRVPRTNVMIELGYLSAVLGRERIALCKYDETTLATDLAGFTFIGMGSYPGKESTAKISDRIGRDISRWAASLPTTAQGLSQADVVHGYSGRWKFSATFDKWFGIEVVPPNYVYTDGFLDIHVPRTGWGGYGCAHLDLYLQVGAYYAHLRCTDRITDVRCQPDGSLCFTSTIHSRKRTEITGEPPQRDGFEDEIQGNNSFEWVFKPREETPLKLSGNYELRLGSLVRACSTVTAEKMLSSTSG